MNKKSEIKNAIEFETFPKSMRDSINKENKLLSQLIDGDVLDVGCGDCRPLSFISEKVQSYLGIEKDEGVYERAKEKCKKFKNATVILGDGLDILKDLKNKGKKYKWIIIIWNTITFFDPKEILPLVSQLGENIYISLVAKGALKERIQYYKDLGQEISVDDDETISSSVWTKQMAYDFSDLKKFEKYLQFKSIKKGRLGNYLIYGIFKK